MTKEERQAIRERCEAAMFWVNLYMKPPYSPTLTDDCLKEFRSLVQNITTLLDALTEAEKTEQMHFAEKLDLLSRCELLRFRAETAETRAGEAVSSANSFKQICEHFDKNPKLASRFQEVSDEYSKRQWFSHAAQLCKVIDDLLERAEEVDEIEEDYKQAVKRRDKMLCDITTERDELKARIDELELEVACLNEKEKAHYEKRCDRYILKARAEALERAIPHDCSLCVNNNTRRWEEPCATCCITRELKRSNWQFDEAKFSEKGDKKDE